MKNIIFMLLLTANLALKASEDGELYRVRLVFYDNKAFGKTIFKHPDRFQSIDRFFITPLAAKKFMLDINNRNHYDRDPKIIMDNLIAFIDLTIKERAEICPGGILPRSMYVHSIKKVHI